MTGVQYRGDRAVTATDETIGRVLREHGCRNLAAALAEFAENGVTKFYASDGYVRGRPSTAVTVRRATRKDQP